MPTEEQLYAEIRKLNSELDAVKRERISQEIGTKRYVENELAKYKEEYEVALQEKISEINERYRKWLDSASSRNVREQEKTEKVLREQQEKLNRLDESYQELQKTMIDAENNASEQENIQRDRAFDLLKMVEESKNNVSKTAHSFFFNGEFEVINRYACNISQTIESGMYQAAIAEASGIIMDFNLLELKAENAFSEWMLDFTDYAITISELRERINKLEEESFLSDSELEYWSSGTYLAFKEKVLKEVEFIEDLKKTGEVEYLKKEKKTKTDFLKLFKKPYKWNDEFSGIESCITNEHSLYNQRIELAKNIKQAYSANGYNIIESGCRKTNDGEEDLFGCYDIKLSIQGLDNLKITLVPARENGTAVKNECFITFYPTTVVNPETTSFTLNCNKDRVKHIVGNIEVYGVDSEKLDKKESEKNTPPNPEEQIKLYERKYH